MGFHLLLLFFGFGQFCFSQFPHFFIIAIQSFAIKGHIVQHFFIIGIGIHQLFQAAVFFAVLAKFFIIGNNFRIGKGYAYFVKTGFDSFKFI